MVAPIRRSRPQVAAARGVAARTVRTVVSGAYENETATMENMEERKFKPGVEPAFVEVGAGMTINLGNFESLRIDVRVTMPCRPTELQDTFERTSLFVAEKLEEEQRAWTNQAVKKTAARRG